MLLDVANRISAQWGSYATGQGAQRTTLLAVPLLAEPSPRYSLKRTFLQYFNKVEHFTDQASDATIFRQALNAVHRGAINIFTDSLQVTNTPGGGWPTTEQKLILTLAQLRSRYCSILISYRSRIDPKPAHLIPHSLWSDPIETARFLYLPLSDFHDN